MQDDTDLGPTNILNTENFHENPRAIVIYRGGSVNPTGGGCIAKWSGGKPSGPGIGPGPTRGPPYIGGLPTPPLR